ncbi:MAG: hypothetical protein ACT4NU_03360 [Chromatiales bacterium]
MTASNPGPIRQLMSLDTAEFFRLLPKALAGVAYVTQTDGVTIDDTGKRIRITLTPQANLRIASLHLPRTLVEFAFEGYSSKDAARFAEHFLRHYQRGGG